MADFMKYDAKTGKASAKAPMAKVTMVTKCKIVKKSMDGKVELKEFKLTILPIPKSVCMINKGIADHTMKSGAKAEGIIAQLLATPDAKIDSIHKQCPGDRFYVKCLPDMPWMKYVETTGMGYIEAPMLKTKTTIECTYTKKALNGESEVKAVKITVEAAP